MASDIAARAAEPDERPSTPHDDTPRAAPSSRREELAAFLFFTVVLAPVLAGIVVGTYGFVVWMSQLVGGPPTG